uniref:Uncharacterized protein n=1 Tax=Ananas comosus var. bracteatus TaxID=296719 RepID=A0A6V7Q2W0_ANACO|nr:unnamed protein product [Ananas comosus var. bracteatus]
MEIVPFRRSLIELDRDTLHTRLGSSHECHSGDGRCAFALVSLMPVGLALYGLVVWRAIVVGCCCRRSGSRQGRRELEPYQTCRARGAPTAGPQIDHELGWFIGSEESSEAARKHRHPSHHPTFE